MRDVRSTAGVRVSVHEDELTTPLIETCEKVGSAAGEAMLVAQEPRKYASADGTGPSIASRGCVPILHMRHFQKNKVLASAGARHYHSIIVLKN